MAPNKLDWPPPEEAHPGRSSPLLVLLCPCLVLLLVVLITTSIVLTVKLRLFCRSPLLSHISRHKC